MKEIPYASLAPIDKRLIDEAEKVMETAYNPYSHFYVGAALLAQNGQIFTGSNVENAAIGSTICAERAAILRANAQGIRMFDKIAIITRGENFDTKEVFASCGSCRQMLYESSQISGRNLEIIMSTTKKDKIVVATIEELLPLAFGPKDLGIDLKRYQF
jgi:cytidine deaminase